MREVRSKAIPFAPFFTVSLPPNRPHPCPSPIKSKERGGKLGAIE
jgi:hypothetical protein